MSKVGTGRTSRGAVILASLSVLMIVASGCARSASSVSVAQLIDDGREAKNPVKVSGLISSEPTRSGDSMVFFIRDDSRGSEQVAVVYGEPALPPVPADRGARGYVERLVIVTGDFDGRVIQADDMILKVYGTYQAP